MEKFKKMFTIFKSTECIAVMALFTALSIILGKFLAFNLFGNTVRISLENIPTIVAAVSYGPIAGLLVGGLADLLGSLMVGYVISPLITVGAMFVGIIAGILGMLLLSDDKPAGRGCYLRCLLTVLPAHLIGSVLIKTIGIHFINMQPYAFLFASRLLTYVAIAIIESFILYILYSRKIMQKMGRRLH